MAHVLLVDDNAVQLGTREMILRSAGFGVSIATSAAGALAVLRSDGAAQKIHAVVTDHIMPGASGAEFVQMLRAVRPDVPVLVVSGMPEAESDYTGMNVIFRQKPIPPPELIDIVKQLTENAA